MDVVWCGHGEDGRWIWCGRGEDGRWMWCGVDMVRMGDGYGAVWTW